MSYRLRFANTLAFRCRAGNVPQRAGQLRKPLTPFVASYTVTMPFKKLLRDPFKQILFELGAGYYARKLATGPEADIRRDFVRSLNLPPAVDGHGRLQFLDVGCGPGHVARGLAQSGYQVTGVDRSRSLLRIARKLGAGERRLDFHLSGTEKLPFANASFDY